MCSRKVEEQCFSCCYLTAGFGRTLEKTCLQKQEGIGTDHSCRSDNVGVAAVVPPESAEVVFAAFAVQRFHAATVIAVLLAAAIAVATGLVPSRCCICCGKEAMLVVGSCNGAEFYNPAPLCCHRCFPSRFLTMPTNDCSLADRVSSGAGSRKKMMRKE